MDKVLINITNQVSAGVNTLFQTAQSLLATVMQVAQHLYLILVRQQVILGVQEFLWGIIWYIGAFMVYRFHRAAWKKEGLAEWDKYAVGLFLVLIVLLLTIRGTEHVITSLPRLFNPEYYAIQEGVQILHQIK